MFYLQGNSDLNLLQQDSFTDTTDKQRYNNASGSPNRQKENDGNNFYGHRGSNPDVNEIIVKIEMKKF